MYHSVPCRYGKNVCSGKQWIVYGGIHCKSSGFFTEHRKSSVPQESYGIYTLVYTLCLQSIPSVIFFLPLHHWVCFESWSRKWERLFSVNRHMGYQEQKSITFRWKPMSQKWCRNKLCGDSVDNTVRSGQQVLDRPSSGRLCIATTDETILDYSFGYNAETRQAIQCFFRMQNLDFSREDFF